MKIYLIAYAANDAFVKSVLTRLHRDTAAPLNSQGLESKMDGKVKTAGKCPVMRVTAAASQYRLVAERAEPRHP